MFSLLDSSRDDYDDDVTRRELIAAQREENVANDEITYIEGKLDDGTVWKLHERRFSPGLKIRFVVLGDVHRIRMKKYVESKPRRSLA